MLVKSSYKFQDHSSLPVRVARLVVETLAATLKNPERAPQFLLVLALGYMAWRTRHTRSTCLVLAGSAALVGTVQVFVGPVGWFYRYEIYCLAFTAARRHLQAECDSRWFDGSDGRTPPECRTCRADPCPASTAGCWSVRLAMFYARPQLGIPQAALGIWQEQAQLGRFASHFHTGPVALNDLGWVSYLRTPDQYTLDLVGLGSYEAFKTTERDRTPAWLDAITREHGIGLVMIYPGVVLQGHSCPLDARRQAVRNRRRPVAERARHHASCSTPHPLPNQACSSTNCSSLRATLPTRFGAAVEPADRRTSAPQQIDIGS